MEEVIQRERYIMPIGLTNNNSPKICMSIRASCLTLSHLYLSLRFSSHRVLLTFFITPMRSRTHSDSARKEINCNHICHNVIKLCTSSRHKDFIVFFTSGHMKHKHRGYKKVRIVVLPSPSNKVSTFVF